MILIVRELTKNDEEAFYEGLRLFSDMDISWYTFIWKEGMSYDEMLAILQNNSKGINVPSNRVPDSMLYAFFNGKIVGRVSVRHELNEYLFSEGGHIGYSVAIKYRRMGIASEMLKQALGYCRDTLKMDKVLITCDDDNVGSYKVIEKNAGVLEEISPSSDETKMKRRYWIVLT